MAGQSGEREPRTQSRTPRPGQSDRSKRPIKKKDPQALSGLPIIHPTSTQLHPSHPDPSDSRPRGPGDLTSLGLTLDPPGGISSSAHSQGPGAKPKVFE